MLANLLAYPDFGECVFANRLSQSPKYRSLPLTSYMSRILHLGRGMSGELVLKSVCALGAGRNPGPIFIPSAIVPATSPHRNRKQFGRTLSDESDSSQVFNNRSLD